MIGLYKKAIVLAIVCCFVGAGVFPSISGTISNVLDSEIAGVTLKNDPPSIEWEKTFGGTDWDDGRCVQQTSDGGYIITGNTLSYGVGGDVWLIKTYSNGNKQWDKTFGGTEYDAGCSVQQTNDGGYIITGGTISYGAGNGDVWLIKTDSSGNKEWDQTFGGSEWDGGWAVQQTSDGGYIITGETYSYGAGSYDAWLIKTDSSGNKEWDNTFGGSYEDYGFSVQQTSDGGYIITGETDSYGAGNGDFWLIKTDSSGNKEWDQTFGGSNQDMGTSVQQINDSGYIITGSTNSYGAGNGDVWLIKIDSSGNKEWDKTFGGTSWDMGTSVQQTSDGGYIIAGFTYSYGAGGRDGWLIKTDSSGNKEWDQTFGGTEMDWVDSAQQTDDGGYVITGLWESYGVGSGDIWLIKLAPPNTPPNKPTIDGPNSGKAGTEYTYRIHASVDPDGDIICFRIDWDGDYIVDECTGYYSSGEVVIIPHTWTEQGTYEIRVKARDTYGLESEWSDPLPVTMPKNKDSDNKDESTRQSILSRLLDGFRGSTDGSDNNLFSTILTKLFTPKTPTTTGSSLINAIFSKLLNLNLR